MSEGLRLLLVFVLMFGWVVYCCILEMWLLDHPTAKVHVSVVMVGVVIILWSAR